MAPQLPCDGDGVCMICKNTPPLEESITCKTCGTLWHTNCLSAKPETLADSIVWDCPDCDTSSLAAAENSGSSPPIFTVAGESDSSGSIREAIWAIESDQSLTAAEKAKKRQQLMSGAAGSSDGPSDDDPEKEKKSDIYSIINGNLNCSFCMQLLDRPVTTPCGHNFCLKCFQRWIGQGKRTCANCRDEIPPKMARQPRINSTLVVAIRMAKMSKCTPANDLPKVYHYIQNENRPDKAFTTERAKKSGKANACSGKIFITVAPDHFGEIPPENDPTRNLGVLVGDTWEDRLECRQWGAHRPMVSGIAGQSKHGAQSVAISGGYIDDEDHGEWFLYTGSGGRDLRGNKRTCREQTTDQKWTNYNESLRLSCRLGYPVRVVRSHKEKRSSYAPEKGLRYDGIYRVEKCWFKLGVKGFKLCRYLLVRCDNHPAPWTSDEQGDRPRPLPVIDELKVAFDITERKTDPSWDYNEEKGCWMWMKPPPRSKIRVSNGGTGKRKRSGGQGRYKSIKKKLLKEFSCRICHKVMVSPLTTPCAHNFCKGCLEAAFSGQSLMRQRSGGRSLRAQKNIMKCPACSNDLADFLKNPQVNRELMGVIEELQREAEEADKNKDSSVAEDINVIQNPESSPSKKAQVTDDEGSSADKSQVLQHIEEVEEEGQSSSESKAQKTHKRAKTNDDHMPGLYEKKSKESNEPEILNDQVESSVVKP